MIPEVLLAVVLFIIILIIILYLLRDRVFPTSTPTPTGEQPIDCAGTFGAYGDCLPLQGACGPTARRRVFNITQEAKNGGTECTFQDGEEFIQACGTTATCPPGPTDPPQPQNCVGTWTLGGCSTDNTCGPGLRVDTYQVLAQAQHGGNDCPFPDGRTIETTCFSSNGACPPDPINCIGAFESGTCSTDATCGPGTRSSTYRRYQESSNGGANCPHPDGFTKQEDCFSLKGACPVSTTAPPLTPVNCIGAFEYGSCSTDGSCGPGTRTKTYRHYQTAVNGGNECQHPDGYTEQESCFSSQGACPMTPPTDCVGGFSALSACNPTCGPGTQYQTYSITTQPQNGGQACPYGEGQVNTVLCNRGDCPQNCIMSDWSAWSSCDKSCGGGKETRTRTVIQPASGGGTACPTDLSESRDCNIETCAPDAVDCVFTTSYGDCSAVCGGGMRTGTYEVLIPASGGGTACPTGTPAPQSCNTEACPAPVNCAYTIEYIGSCNAECGGGTQQGIYNISTFPSNGGIACPTGTPAPRACNTDPCPTQGPDRKNCWLGQAASPHWTTQGVMTEPECNVIRTNNPTVTTIWADDMPTGECPIVCPPSTDPCKTNVCISADNEPFICLPFDNLNAWTIFIATFALGQFKLGRYTNVTNTYTLVSQNPSNIHNITFSSNGSLYGVGDVYPVGYFALNQTTGAETKFGDLGFPSTFDSRVNALCAASNGGLFLTTSTSGSTAWRDKFWRVNIDSSVSDLGYFSTGGMIGTPNWTPMGGLETFENDMYVTVGKPTVNNEVRLFRINPFSPLSSEDLGVISPPAYDNLCVVTLNGQKHLCGMMTGATDKKLYRLDWTSTPRSVSAIPITGVTNLGETGDIILGAASRIGC